MTTYGHEPGQTLEKLVARMKADIDKREGDNPSNAGASAGRAYDEFIGQNLENAEAEATRIMNEGQGLTGESLREKLTEWQAMNHYAATLRVQQQRMADFDRAKAQLLEAAQDRAAAAEAYRALTGKEYPQPRRLP